jgi:broad specificity phosphatase PhoE
MPNDTTEDGLPILKNPATASLSQTEEGLPILKKKDGGVPVSTGSVNSSQASNSQSPSSSTQPTQPKYVVHSDGTTTPYNYHIASIDNSIQNNQQNSGDNTNIQHPVVAPSSSDIAAKKASVKEDNETAIDNTVKKIVAQKGEGGTTGVNPILEKQKLQNQLQNGEVSVGYDKQGNLGLKQNAGGFLDAFTKARDEANKEAADADLFTHGLNNTERVAILKNKQQEDANNPFIGTKENFGSTIGRMTGSLEQPLENLGVGAIAGGAAVAAAPTTAGASLEGLPTALGVALGSKDAFNIGYASEVQRAYGAIKKANPNISDIDAMNEAEKQGNVGGTAGLVTNIALMGGSVEGGGNLMKDAISDGAKDVIGKAVSGTAKMAALPALGQAATEEAGNLNGVKTSQSDVLNDAVQTFKNNLTPAVVLHLLGAGATGLTELPKPVENSLKLAATELPPEQVKATLEGGEKTGFYPTGTAELVTHDINNFKEATDKIPSEIPDEKKAEIAPLIQNKQALVEEQKTKDSSFKDSYQEKIDNVDNQIKQIINKPTEEDVNNNSSQLNTDQNGKSSKEADASSEGRQEVNQNEEAVKPEKETASSIDNEKPINDKIEPNDTFRTLDYGEHKGEEESKEKQEEIKQDILSDKPLGKTGEKFSDFVNRVVPAFKDLIDKEPNNTTVVTHSSVIKALDVWEDMGRPDIESMTDKQKQKFAEKYVKEDIEKEGGVSTFKGEDGKVIHAIRHGETEDNKMSEFREDNTKLTSKGEGQAAKAGQELNKITDGDVPKIISSDLPRAIHTSNIISEQLGKENTGGEEPPTENAKPIAEENEPPKTVGVSHDALTKLANKLGLEEPKRGEFLSPKDQVARGRELLKAGADPEQIGKDFQADGKVSADNISVVRAHLENLTKEADQVREKFGKNSEEYKTAKTAIQDWNDKVAKPMGTSAGAALASLQGETDLDTGSFVSMERKYNALTGKDFTPEQEAKTKELTGKVNELEAKVQDLTKQLSEAINKAVDEEKDNPKSIKEKANSVANAIRKGKLSRPDSFSAATPASLVWDGAIETAAKTIEIGGSVAQAISDGIDHIKASEWYKNLESTKQKQAVKDFENHLTEQLKNKDVLTRFIDKKDGKFTTEEAKQIWDYAKKTYLDNGVKYEDMVKNVSYDLNLTSDQIQKAIATPKGAREISDEMYRAQHNRDLAVRKATDYVNHAADPRWVKALKAIPNGFFALKTFGHGTVGFITHAGTNIFKPDAWHAYWPNAIKQFDFAFGGMGKDGLARYQRAMENLRNDPQFTFWQRAGLAVDPKESYEEYQGIGRWMGKIGLAGERGFNALKIYRLERAKGIYEGLPDAQKADPETAKVIAQSVNHESGTTEATPFKGANTAFFAPKLEISRWQRLVTDPATAIKTVANWKDATPAEKAQSVRVAKNAAQLAATYMAALAANSGLLAVTGSKQKVNYTDPTKSDFLKFKFGNDHTLDVSGGMLSTFDFIAGMIGAATLPKNDLPGGEQRSDVMAKDVWRYGTGRLSPFAGTAKDFATQKDFSGNTMPFSNDKPSKGGHKLTWAEYAENEQTPIPVAEFIKTLHEKGVNESQTSAIIKAAIGATIVGGTGAHIGNSPKEKKKGAYGGAGASGGY